MPPPRWPVSIRRWPATPFLHWARLEAVRQQAAADGELIDPWHLAAIIEGLRLRIDPRLRSPSAGRSSRLPAPRSCSINGWWRRISIRKGRSRAPRRCSRHNPRRYRRCSPRQAWAPEFWIPAFLRALAREAEAGLDLLLALERAWFAARRAVASRRKSSHAGAVIDLLAATPVVSATTLAARLGIAVKNAIRLLDELTAADITVEVTHR